MFTCGPSTDSLDRISVFLNKNEPSDGIVHKVNESDNGVVLYKYRNATIDDNDKMITCSAGQDEGTIQLTVFCEYTICCVRINSLLKICISII